MPISIPYPQTVELYDGSVVQITDDVWKNRQLVVETDKPEPEVRNALTANGFKPAILEFNKDGQIGSGMVKGVKEWQIHIRLFRHGPHIQIDGEVEVSNSYFEHLGHGWIPGFQTSMDVVMRHFGKLWIYHKGYKKYVRRIINESVIRLPDPGSKTSVAMAAIAGVLLLGLILALKK